MYTIHFSNGELKKAETLKQARKIALQFFRMAKNRRYGLHLNYFTPAAITKNGKMIFSINNQGVESFYEWNF